MIIDLFNYDKIEQKLLSELGHKKKAGQVIICSGESTHYYSMSLGNKSILPNQSHLHVLYILCPPIASKQYVNRLKCQLKNIADYTPDKVVVYQPMLYSFPHEYDACLIKNMVNNSFASSGQIFYIRPGVCFDSFIHPFLFILSNQIYYDAIENKRINFFMLDDLAEMLIFLGFECDQQYHQIHLTGPTNYDLEELSFLFNQCLNTPFLYKNVSIDNLKSFYSRLGYSYYYSNQFILLTMAAMNNHFAAVSDDYMYLLGRAPKNILSNFV
ncbi:hypothetical protein H0A36_22360 [Endozoicomonas sp. SM1973]|uniref:Uncharacterized protein n=1 Tax=Spartinivicinus marinus TaxID=2994442 RepID=A0A853IFF1_9GAMM|nr:hypothetical protein [Spartinivicinus marinus]MCX4029086.1 hypothetical protein [Spartinivicinus marinus]NYZ68764.1 hypothetical protein [Spartinivicinus marinus]